MRFLTTLCFVAFLNISSFANTINNVIIITEPPEGYSTTFLELDDKKEYISSNVALTESEKEVNAKYIYSVLKKEGWSDNAIYAFLGNVDHESYLNPGKWQNGKTNNGKFGFGLVQWTPASKKILNYSKEYNVDANCIDVQIDFLEHDAVTKKNWMIHKSYHQTYHEFIKDDTHSVEWLTGSFYTNYEMAFDGSLGRRVRLAHKWQDYFEEQ